MLEVRVPATSANLGSGLDSLGLALSLELTLTYHPSSSLHIFTEGEGADELPTDESNLIWSCATKLYEEMTGEPLPSGVVRVTNHIPVSRGLGSSAAAVVAGLLLGNALLPHPLGRAALLERATALEGHPDNVAAALYGGFVLVYRNRHHQLAVSQYAPPPLISLLAIPSYPVPTKDSRAILPSHVARDDAIFNAQRVGLWVHAMASRDWSLLRDAAEDRLHQPYRTQLVAGLDDLIQTSYAHGAYSATLSGSGPTILALVPPDNVSDVESAWTALAIHYDWPLQVVRSSPVADAASVKFHSPSNAASDG
ncbi:homoserine kinase [Sulfobacillus sp. hq2]|uniref:homoserine kinase n=1 Tax=Sulfobacillus TaxID=28033 RepID=UPI000CD0EA76|nr:homoserine kinase [Sulfobacillus sp. hq2]POB09121.1 homoserine kinase [Sulfobacillus sp. hq2]